MNLQRRQLRQAGQVTPARQAGQVAVEYVLLLIMAVTLALTLRQCVSRSPDEPGAIVNLWNKLLNTIGSDKADDVE